MTARQRDRRPLERAAALNAPAEAAIVVMPRASTAWPTAQALWITARGWAEAALAHFGAAWIVTPDGTWRPEEIPRLPAAARSRGRTLPVPGVVRTAVKDLRLWHRQSAFTVDADGPWSQYVLSLVWEHHDLFNSAGRQLATAMGAPLVRYVHAPQVWEARRWGVRRPLWGRSLERIELRHLEEADVVACVSTAVRDRLLGMGVKPDRVVLAPMAVDTDVFSPHGESTRSALGIADDAVVVGWCGSFRGFHGLDRLVQAFAAAQRQRPALHLLLVGDGPMRDIVAGAVREADLAAQVTFSGAVAHAAMPGHLRMMDIAVVSSDARGEFHYSPLKLREYAACGLPVVAPAEGELVELAGAPFLSLHPPGDTDALSAAFVSLADDAAGRRARGEAARAHAVLHWTWSAQLRRVLEHCT